MKYRKLRKYKYQVVEDDVEIKTDTIFTLKLIDTRWIRVIENKITIKNGYCWDGATCAIDTKSFMVASLIHDALYQLIRLKKVDKTYRLKADIILRELCLRYKMPEFRANYVFHAVRWFGGKYINVGKPQDIIYEV